MAYLDESRLGQFSEIVGQVSCFKASSVRALATKLGLIWRR